MGAYAGTVGGEVILDQSARTKKAYEDLAVDLAKPIGFQIHQSAEAIKADLASELPKFAALREQLDSTATAFTDFFKAGGGLSLTARQVRAPVSAFPAPRLARLKNRRNKSRPRKARSAFSLLSGPRAMPSFSLRQSN